ncbi:hypothetical protein DSM106972_014810 [Dulcicalothrix desertica PCC 7102]|uniref:Uncharacterized protein n=2 Tax=Dulcicalothrix desertica TaxID=32056 RepID=A0A3S1CS18_9CYAN|nr:hypothetical protein [Dulcicalothrix desertica]RUT08313.1 hypothetical protein DSM106972_014810 [Dulcicalothrix desertica PCC 7102]TWH40178.1 hypothetical protein CAL7102_09481 [Dulcicalothrix desertica PCC 7102]
MTKTAFNTQSLEIKINYITQLLDKLTNDYKNTKQERKEIASQFYIIDEEFSLLEEIELLTVNIRGYASQIQATAKIENQQEAIGQLQAMNAFDIPVIAQFYFNNNDNYEQIKGYIRNLDYLRLVILEFLCP